MLIILNEDSTPLIPPPLVQDEVFNHIEGTEMDKVREQVVAKREWLNTNMAACHLLPKSTDPTTTCAQIRAELKVYMNLKP